jgi:hypothetical protein
VRCTLSWRSLVLSLLAVASSAAAQGPATCPHPYFPLEEGLQLTYRAGRSEVRVTTRDVRPSEAGQEAMLDVELKGRKGSTAATCSAQGVQTAAGGLEGTLLAASGMDVEVLQAEGVAVPPPAEMLAGGSWKNSLAVRMRPPENMKLPGGMRPVITTAFEKESTVEGEEEVQVAAGTFRALRVRNRTTARGASASADSGRTIDSVLWFAPGVGLVKVQTGDSVDLELVQVKRPGAVASPKAGGAKKARSAAPATRTP